MDLKIILVYLLILFPFSIISQSTTKSIKGTLTGVENNKKDTPLVGANIYWLNTQIGTTSDKNGNFRIERITDNNILIVSFMGYTNDTINTVGKDEIEVRLKPSITLDDVNIVYRKKSTETDFINPISVNNIGEKELSKAACCNLCESFETSPAVDVSYTDAVTGTKQLMMLGLAGKYTLISRENMPDIRGLSSIYGLTYIPGTWIENIQLIKGTGSVTNGFESMAGQINVELRKPDKMDNLYLSVYANQEGRIETNAHLKFETSKNIKSALFVHASNSSFKHDENKDSFIDKPLFKQFIVLNRWELSNNNGTRIQLGAKATYIDNIGGQTNFNQDEDEGTTNYWGMHLLMKRIEGWTKMAKTFDEKPYQSMELQISGSLHNQESFFGLNNYDASQNSLYTNFIFQSIFGNSDHKYKTGLSIQYDDYKEEFNSINYNRVENVPGVFFEYTYCFNDKFSYVAGLRADYHNIFGAFVTPRIHIRYAPTEKTVIRVSSGRGQRTANIFSENNALMASSRDFVIMGDNTDKPFGLSPEVAWNSGINLSQYFTLNYREGIIAIDFYHTEFENQIVVDLEQSPQQAIFYNLVGRSYSNSVQAQIDYELLKRFDVRVAYRWYDVKTNYNGTILEKPLISQHRAFINFAYETRKKWKFDLTINWQGSKRIPSTESNPIEYRVPDKSPKFYIVNTHISKSWGKKFESYVGIENILGFTQDDPIIASNQAFSPYFDSSLIWGPIFGRSIYFGIKYRI